VGNTARQGVQNMNFLIVCVKHERLISMTSSTA